MLMCDFCFIVIPEIIYDWFDFYLIDSESEIALIKFKRRQTFSM